ncbi:hypothetical protein PGT21_021776 [Puccinia graminis f. sp. tritici]|uniref:Uncharacterized protein n=1 Tax=Puccinia graminis f. sp. tritici TaxID=56615 RepID=A0A5B0MMU4_PUCGR|nr:hypothetical protein PGT21_021776 [Puccinia graminis f. sp. tritici]
MLHFYPYIIPVSHFSQILNLSFIHEQSQPLFWKYLNGWTDHQGAGSQLLAQCLQEFCGYFWNGKAFDNSFKYHQFVFQISSRIRKHLETRTDGSTSPGQKSVEEIEAFFCKAQLIMNYVEEFSQTVKKNQWISRFHPRPRASLAQLRHLAFLICDHMSPIYKFEAEVNVFNISQELELHGFPYCIQHTMLAIMGNKHYSFGDLRRTVLAIMEQAEQKQTDWIGKLYERLEMTVSQVVMSCQSDVQPRADGVYMKQDGFSEEIVARLTELEHFLIQELSYNEVQNKLLSWDKVFLAVRQELSSASSENVDALIRLLKHGHRVRRNLPVFHHAYYLMTQTNEREKKIVFEVMRHKLKELQKEMPTHAFERIREITKLTQAISRQTLYKVWTDRLLGKLTKLPHDLAMTVDGLMADCSRAILLKKMDAVCADYRVQTILDPVRDRLNLDARNLLRRARLLLASKRVTDEVHIMAKMLFHNAFADFSLFNVGDLYLRFLSLVNKQ